MIRLWTDHTTGKVKILFIGNSHTYFNDMPRTAGDMVEALTGESVDVTMLAYSYKELDWHVKSEYFAVRFNILHGGYDYCIVQQAAHPFPGAEATARWLSRIADMCRSVGTKPILIQTWAEKDIPEQQEELSTGNAKAAEMAGVPMAPTGEIWEAVMNAHPEIELFNDSEHAGPYGAYLLSLVLSYMIVSDRTGGAPDISKIGNAARDFAAPDDIDYDAPVVCESKDGVGVVLDDAKAGAIRDAVAAYFKEG